MRFSVSLDRTDKPKPYLIANAFVFEHKANGCVERKRVDYIRVYAIDVFRVNDVLERVNRFHVPTLHMICAGLIARSYRLSQRELADNKNCERDEENDKPNLHHKVERAILPHLVLKRRLLPSIAR